MDPDTIITVAVAPFYALAVSMSCYLAASACKGIYSMFQSAAQTQMTDTTSPQTTHQV